MSPRFSLDSSEPTAATKEEMTEEIREGHRCRPQDSEGDSDPTGCTFP